MKSRIGVVTCLTLNIGLVLTLPLNKSRGDAIHYQSSIIFEESSTSEDYGDSSRVLSLIYRTNKGHMDVDSASAISFPKADGEDGEEHKNPGGFARPTVNSSEPREAMNGANATLKLSMAAEYNQRERELTYDDMSITNNPITTTMIAVSESSGTPDLNGNGSALLSESSDEPDEVGTLNRKFEGFAKGSSTNDNELSVNSHHQASLHSELSNFSLSKGGSANCSHNHRQTSDGSCVEVSDF